MGLFVVVDQILEWSETQNQCFDFELYYQSLGKCFDFELYYQSLGKCFESQEKQMQSMVVEQLNQIQNSQLL